MELQISQAYSLSVNYVWLSFWSYQVDIWMLIQTTLFFEGVHTVFYTASTVTQKFSISSQTNTFHILNSTCR